MAEFSGIVTATKSDIVPLDSPDVFGMQAIVSSVSESDFVRAIERCDRLG